MDPSQSESAGMLETLEQGEGGTFVPTPSELPGMQVDSPGLSFAEVGDSYKRAAALKSFRTGVVTYGPVAMKVIAVLVLAIMIMFVAVYVVFMIADAINWGEWLHGHASRHRLISWIPIFAPADFLKYMACPPRWFTMLGNWIYDDHVLSSLW